MVSAEIITLTEGKPPPYRASKLHLEKLIYKTSSTVNKSFLFDVSFISYIPGYLTHIKYPVVKYYHNDDTMNLNKHYETYVFVQ